MLYKTKWTFLCKYTQKPRILFSALWTLPASLSPPACVPSTLLASSRSPLSSYIAVWFWLLNYQAPATTILLVVRVLPKAPFPSGSFCYSYFLICLFYLLHCVILKDREYVLYIFVFLTVLIMMFGQIGLSKCGVNDCLWKFSAWSQPGVEQTLTSSSFL